MTWSLPDTYHLAGHGRGTATFKFYEGRDILRVLGLEHPDTLTTRHELARWTGEAEREG
jgi:hypothetical protein